MMGYSEEELVALPQSKAHPPEDLPWICERIEMNAAGYLSRTENVPLVRRDGSVFYTDVSSHPINYKGRRCLINFFHDITQRRESEERLRRSESRYKALVESSPDAVIMCDLEGRIIFASSQAAERHEVGDASDLVGRSAMDLVVPQDRGLMTRNIGRLLETGIRRNDEYTGLRRDETTFFGEISASVIYSVSGEPEAFVAIYRDITDRKEAQRELQKEQDALRQMLQASDHDRELITYELHDGVAQRIAGALLYFDAMLQEDPVLTDEARASLDAGMTALRQACAEVRSLMNRTRTPLLNMFGLKTAIADFIDQFGDRPNAPEITYRCETRFKRLEPVLENTIFRVAQEALTNACIHGQSERVWVSLIQHDEEVFLEVKDNGVGFDLSQVKENRFGLHGIRERTRLLGKDLEIVSTPGEGTHIRATFPLVHEEKRAE
jgi:PAS domain S-box-containing protein